MTSQLRPGVIVAALLALVAGVIGLRTLASSESDTVPSGQPFVVEADYPATEDQAPIDLDWTRPPAPRNPFVAAPHSQLTGTAGAGPATPGAIPDGTDIGGGSGLTGGDTSALDDSSAANTSSPEPAAPLSNAAPPPEPGEVVEIEIGPDSPNRLGG